MTPIWLTVVVAVLTSGGALVGSLGGQWLASGRAYRLAAIERDNRLADRDRQSREDAYAKVLTAARAFPPPGEADPGTALAAVEDAAAYVDLYAPAIADGPMATVLASASRVANLLRTSSPTSRVVAEALEEYRAALRVLRDAMRADLAKS